MAPRRPARVLLLLLALAGLMPDWAQAWTMELKAAADFKFAGGADFWTAGPGCGPNLKALDTDPNNATAAVLVRASSTCAKPVTTDIRSGSPGVDGSATTVKPSPVPITRVQLDLDYVIGSDLH